MEIYESYHVEVYCGCEYVSVLVVCVVAAGFCSSGSGKYADIVALGIKA